VKLLEKWQRQAARLKQEVYALALACKDPRVPWYAKLLALGIVAYALSPIDLIPDFIPVLGYLDDLILVPLGIYFLLKLIPPDVLADCRERARLAATTKTPARWLAAVVIITVWIVLALLAVRWMIDVMTD
jgi:uncharacterized membrane protein YkvA (DUF1232 family)